MVNKSGKRIYKRLHVRIVTPIGVKDQRLDFCAPPRQGFGEGAIQEILERVSEDLEKKNPGLEFRLVELAPDRFNFVCEGTKQEPARQSAPAQ
jgi:hypothetical protein